MKLYVARHTQATHNIQRTCNADPTFDVHLTELGIEQAKQLAGELAGIAFNAIYISELPRTRETASYLSQYSSTPVVVDSRLNENRSGFEGQPIDDFLAAFNSSKDKWHVRFNDGESLADAKQRVKEFLDDLQTKDYTSVLVVTHGYIVECINALIKGIDFELAATFQIPQGSYQLFTVD